MSEVKRANGHRLDGILPVSEPQVPGPQPTEKDVDFDLKVSLSAVRSLRSSVPTDAHSARNLGTEREGNAVLIDADGTLVTIGYLITEATEVFIGGSDGKSIPAQVVGYDHSTGFGLVRTIEPLDSPPLVIAQNVNKIVKDTPVVIASAGGVKSSILGKVADRREFVGSWEFMLETAFFTTPFHPRWSGGALIDPKSGFLVGIGSLFVQEAGGSGGQEQGNMFVPTDLLEPIYQDLISTGRVQKGSRPWLGMQTTEALGNLIVSSIHEGGPADQAGVQTGDIIDHIENDEIESLGDMYRKIWSVGTAGDDIRIGLIRGSRAFDVIIKSGDRHEFLKIPLRH